MADDDIRQARVRMALGALDGVVRCAEDLAGKATLRAPIREGFLRQSAAVVLIVNDQRFEGEGSASMARQAVRAAVLAGRRTHIDAEISFNTVYAARQHEELDWHHPKGGEAKYLERPLREGASRYERIIELAAATAVEAA